MKKNELAERGNGEDEFEEEIISIEEENEKESEKETEQETAKPVEKQTTKQNEPINETYEAFGQSSRFGLTNTLTGDSIEGFDEEKDQGHVLAYKLILNKLSKISIALGI